MKNKIKTILKTNPIFYTIYTIIFSTLLKVFGFFLKTDEHIILFNSFGGKKYDDSPKAIYEYMIGNGKYTNYKMYWSLDNIEMSIPGPAIIVKNDSLRYFIIALKAKYWISNSSIERGLTFKKKNTIYINTWHGSALKKMGIDTKEENFRFRFSKYDYMYAQSQYDIDIFSHAFQLPKKIFQLVGLPRNDELVNIKAEEMRSIKSKLNLPADKKIILYAPTFREYERDEYGCIMKPPIDLSLWQEKLSSDYILLFRAHYEVNKILNIQNNGFVFDFTSYPNLNELLKIADILVSDYSSIMIDYAITERPIFSYAYDLELYQEKRGLYIDLRKELPNGCCMSEIELLSKLDKINFQNQKKKTKKFKDKYVEKCGDASSYIDTLILGCERDGSN